MPEPEITRIEGAFLYIPIHFIFKYRQANQEMYKITWDKETGGVLLHSRIVDGTLGTSPRPVFWEELDLLKLNELGWEYPHSDAPLLWAINKQYWYQGKLLFEAKGANIYDEVTVVFQPHVEPMALKPVNVKKMLERCKDYIFLLESEAIEFIHETYIQYAGARKSVEKVAANQLDYEALATKVEKKLKTKMAIVKEDCDSFDIVPLEEAEKQGKKIYQTTRIDRFLASFSGGKDSQVVLDLCTRAIPSTEFEVIYSNTGYELPPSLTLYDEVQKYYKEKYPDLKFSVARNHESVLNYWDKIGTPSDTHRWCCSIMKTAPLYRMLKVSDNKQARVLTFDGVRAEESVKRGSYYRLGKGKHSAITNAHPIINWNTAEIFLYLFKYNLPLNQAYRFGKARVGCLICPFSTAWDDMIASKRYGKELKPFIDRLVSWSKDNKIGKVDDFIKERRWKIKAIGNTDLSNSIVSFTENNNIFSATVKNPLHSFYEWLPALCEYTIESFGMEDKGSLKFNGSIFNFHLKTDKSNNQYVFEIENAPMQLKILLRRVINKGTYCIRCEVCEVDCPTGALSILPNVVINKSKCIHCHKCLNSHDLGCISADCVRMVKNMNNNENTKIQGYKTFGFREEWLQEYLVDPIYFWHSNSLGTAQVDGFKAWLKDAEINDVKNKLTIFGELLQHNYVDESNLTWEMIVTNLSYNSFIFNWFVNNIRFGQEYDRKILESMINEQGFSNKGKTVPNAVAALVQTFDYSPIGDVLNMKIQNEGKSYVRGSYQELSKEGLAYCLYKYAEKNRVLSLRVSDFYSDECSSGPFRVFGISKPEFINKLRALNSANNRVLIAELSMGLDSITLREDLNPITCLETMLTQ